ncbi:MAG: hypothetical protein M1594_01155 [Candidatus Marsarchaeota archaeon]|nr:hypothetical protein [Candidatus Marsarchaeota archaeon]
MDEEWSDFDDIAAVNSELRYLTLELMKISYNKKKSFKLIVSEFIENAEFLKKRLAEDKVD